jgi:fructose-bisphosphate aldolase, class II
MLVNLKTVLKKADELEYAVGGFNITTLESAMAIVQAAEQEQSPVIFQISEKTIDYMGLEVAYAITKTLADQSPVPVVIHLDHGRNFKLAEQALKIGFSSIMLDVSKMEKDKRIPFVAQFVKKAHKLGASVEAEEDMIGGREDYVVGDNSHFTDPKRAKAFTENTEIDCFAVSIGESHGKPLPNEKLDLNLLSQIDRIVRVPLVLHGASSTPEPIVRQVISRGVRKINIDTDLRLAFTKELRHTLEDKKIYDPREELRPSTDEIRDIVIEKIKLFGSDKKG